MYLEPHNHHPDPPTQFLYTHIMIIFEVHVNPNLSDLKRRCSLLHTWCVFTRNKWFWFHGFVPLKVLGGSVHILPIISRDGCLFYWTCLFCFFLLVYLNKNSFFENGNKRVNILFKLCKCIMFCEIMLRCGGLLQRSFKKEKRKKKKAEMFLARRLSESKHPCSDAQLILVLKLG